MSPSYYKDGASAVGEAIASIRAHVEAGFLSNQKLLLGPQIPRTTPRYEEISTIFKGQTSLDTLLENAVFPVGILCDSASVKAAQKHDDAYLAGSAAELRALAEKLGSGGLPASLKRFLIYIPLKSKDALVDAFDTRLKGLQ